MIARYNLMSAYNSKLSIEINETRRDVTFTFSPVKDEYVIMHCPMENKWKELVKLANLIPNVSDVELTVILPVSSVYTGENLYQVESGNAVFVRAKVGEPGCSSFEIACVYDTQGGKGNVAFSFPKLPDGFFTCLQFLLERDEVLTEKV